MARLADRQRQVTSTPCTLTVQTRARKKTRHAHHLTLYPVYNIFYDKSYRMIDQGRYLYPLQVQPARSRPCPAMIHEFACFQQNLSQLYSARASRLASVARATCEHSPPTVAPASWSLYPRDLRYVIVFLRVSCNRPVYYANRNPAFGRKCAKKRISPPKLFHVFFMVLFLSRGVWYVLVKTQCGVQS